MKAICAAGLGFVVTALGAAESVETAIVAAMQLSERRNYAWITSVVDNARAYEIEGRTEVGGYTWIRQPVPRSLARRLGRAAEPRVEAFHLAGDAAIRTDEGWRCPRELPRCHDDWIGDDGPFVRGAGAPSIWNPTDPLALAAPPSRWAFGGAPRRKQPYSNLQFGANLPHEELAVIVCSNTSIERRGDVVTGTLSNLGAELLLLREDREEVTMLAAAGAFDLTLGDDTVLKYTLRLEGILEVDGRKVHVRQTNRTFIKDVGRTTLEVPAEVRFKLEG